MTKFIVTKDATRPFGRDTECFYCHQLIGSPHSDDCVLINKKVKVRMFVDYEIEVPARWEKHNIEFARNEGSWCANNAIRELEEYFDNESGENNCMCDASYFEYLGGDSEPFLMER